MLVLPDEPKINFPKPGTVTEAHPGVVAAGGNLNPENVIRAYKQGLFPWYNDEEPILWWSPDPRMVLYPEKIRLQPDVLKLIRNKDYEFRLNHGTEEIIRACAKSQRKDQDGTWINSTIISSYTELAKSNDVWSVGVWKKGVLLGGLYGVKLGAIFFGESMFSRESNTSKAALTMLCTEFKNDIKLIDCQQETSHLRFMGAQNIKRELFLYLVNLYT